MIAAPSKAIPSLLNSLHAFPTPCASSGYPGSGVPQTICLEIPFLFSLHSESLLFL